MGSKLSGTPVDTDSLRCDLSGPGSVTVVHGEAELFVHRRSGCVAGIDVQHSGAHSEACQMVQSGDNKAAAKAMEMHEAMLTKVRSVHVHKAP